MIGSRSNLDQLSTTERRGAGQAPPDSVPTSTPSTFALADLSGADDIKAIEPLTGTGFLARTGTNTWALVPAGPDPGDVVTWDGANDAHSFVFYSGAGSGTIYTVSAADARAALGLGTAALADLGSANGEVPTWIVGGISAGPPYLEIPVIESGGALRNVTTNGNDGWNWGTTQISRLGLGVAADGTNELTIAGQSLQSMNASYPTWQGPPLTARSTFIQSDDANAETALNLLQMGDAATIVLARGGGSFASPSGVLNTDNLGGLFWSSRKSDGNWAFPASIQVVAEEDHTASATGTSMRFASGIAGGTSTAERMRIDSGANLLIGTTTATGLTGAGGLKLGSATDASSVTAASFITAGGIAVAKKAYIGDLVDLASNWQLQPNRDDIATDAFVFRRVAAGTRNANVFTLFNDGTANFPNTLWVGSGSPAYIAAGCAYAELILVGTTSAPAAANSLRVAGALRTGTPSGGSQGEWKLGQHVAASPVDNDVLVRIDIGGTAIDLLGRLA